MERAEAAQLTKEFVNLLHAAVLGHDEILSERVDIVGDVFESGNAGEHDVGYTFDVEFEGHSFNIEVFGPPVDP